MIYINGYKVDLSCEVIMVYTGRKRTDPRKQYVKTGVPLVGDDVDGKTI